MAQEKVETKKDKTLTNLNLIIDKDVYERLKGYALLKRITVGQALEEGGRILLAQFDKEEAEGLK